MKRSLKIIACGVLENEIKAAAVKDNLIIHEEYLTAGLHEEPEKLRKELQAAVACASEEVDAGLADYDAIVIGYGLCGRGTVGLRAGSVPLIIPRVHDCIAMFLGSHKRYKEQFTETPGTFYMTEGWYEHKTQPLSVKRKNDKQFQGNWDINIGYDSIKRKYGAENAAEIYDFLNTWKRNYTRSVYIDTGSERGPVYESYARDLADELGWKYEKLNGSAALFTAMLNSIHTDDEVLVVPPRHCTAYDPIKHGLYAFDPATGDVSVWERELPVSDKTGNDNAEKRIRKGFGLGIDAGGTCTDAVIYDFDKSCVVEKSKSPTTKWDFTIGITGVLEKLDPEKLSKIGMTVVSTTLATNAIVENRGRKVGLIVMPLGEIPAGRIEHNPWRIVSGRLSITGDELQQIDEEEIKRVAAGLIELEHVEAFAVSGYGSTVNPSHELQIKRIIEAETGLGVCCGHELSSTLNFFVRAYTAVLNAGIIPLLEQFIGELENALHGMNIGGGIMIVRGDGSLMSREKAVLHPVETTLSGPAASIAGAKFLIGESAGSEDARPAESDAVIIDVGGTTSDIGFIRNGRIRLDAEGARVGRWRTHIRAVDMYTLGAGGDSRILIENRELKVGPCRVVPFGRLNEIEGSEQAVSFIEDIHPDFCSSTAPMEILALTGRSPDRELGPDEKNIVNLLKQRPHSVRELAIKLKHGVWKLVGTKKLENTAVVQRFGLTPTDLFTASGDISLWPPELSGRTAKLYGTIWGDDSGDIGEAVLDTIADNLLQTLLLQELNLPDDPSDAVLDSSTFKALLANLKGASRSLRLSPSLNSRLVGVGAAAPLLLSKLARHLDTELIIPENGDVANAVGAVCSMVTVQREASVIPGADGSFIVNGFDGAFRFVEYEEACDFLEKNIAAEVRKDAIKAGTDETRIIWTAENRMGPTSDGNCIFLGRDYRVEITGLPVI